MAATEKIGAVELSSFGLRLGRLDGNVDMPAFKAILEEHDFESNLLVLDEKNIQIRLIGFYASRTAMGTAIENFKTQIKSAVKQVWTFTNHGFQETCVLNEGFKCNPYSSAVEILIKLTITEA